MERAAALARDRPLAGLVVVAAAIGVASGIKSLDNGAVGESARGYDLMAEHGAWPAAREYGYLHSETLTTSAPAFQAAIFGREDADGPFARQRPGSACARHGGRPSSQAQWTHPISVEALRASVLAAGAAHRRCSGRGDRRHLRERRARSRREPRPAGAPSCSRARGRCWSALRVRSSRRPRSSRYCSG
jgi:hypothetical protein